MEYQDLTEKKLSRTEHYSGPIFSVHTDEVLLPNGHTSYREVVDHCDGVAVLALDEADNALVVSQYRYVFSREILELPAGKLDAGEEPLAGALRELREETGAVPEKIVSLGRILPAPGCYTEVLHLYLATGLHMEGQHLDPDEFLRLGRIPFEDLVEKCVRGEVEDAKTVAAVLRARLLR